MQLVRPRAALAALLVVVPLAGCGAATTGASAATGALPPLPARSAPPELPIFASPHAGDVQVPAELLADEATALAAPAADVAPAAARPVAAAPAPRATPTTRAVPATAPPRTLAPVPTPAPVPTRPSPGDFTGVYASVAAATGYLVAQNCTDHQTYLGTGFLVAPDLVLTDDHVVAGAGSWTFTLGGHDRAGVVVGRDPVQDVALVRLATPVPAVAPLVLRADRPAVGTPVAAVGYALALGVDVEAPSLAAGVVSGVDRSVDVDLGDHVAHTRTGLLQTDVQTNHGASGGPVVALDGSVVGMVDGVVGDPADVQLSIGSPTARGLVATWAARRTAVPLGC